MSEAARRLRANRVIEGRQCGWCGLPLAFGDESAVCQACETAVHAACWDRELGCPTEGCVNRPLRRLEAEVEPEGAPAAGELTEFQMRCPHCGNATPRDIALCIYCGLVPTPDGVYRGPKTTAPGAVASLVFGILGLFICGIIFGAVAISKADAAKKAIAANPAYEGAGYATAGRILGIVSVTFWGLGLLIKLITAFATAAGQ